MRKALLAGVAAVVGLGVGSANATVDVTATITKDKDVIITEILFVSKFVILAVDVDIEADKFAESLALLNQDNSENSACENCAEKKDSIVDSGSDNSGILSINQASGNMNNQGNVVAVAVDVRVVPPDGDGGPDGEQFEEDTGFAEAQAAAEQINQFSSVDSINLFFRDAEIVDSINNNAGVVHVNQSAGNMNNQGNALSMSVSFAIGGVALSEADLGQFNFFNTVLESDQVTGECTAEGCEQAGVGIHKSALIAGSINSNAGIVGVNQSSGSFANQANVVAFGAVLLP